MEAKKLFLTTLITVGVLLLAFGLIFGNSGNVAADKVDKIKDKNYIDSLRNKDSTETLNGITKTYITTDKGLILEDDKEILLELSLLTPYENKVSSGDSIKVAGFYVGEFSDKAKWFDKIDKYDLSNDYKVKDKDYVWKYLVETGKIVCVEKDEVAVTEANCFNQTEETWIEFDKWKELPHSNIEIGLFTNTIEGENIEFIPTIEGFDILEWASYLVTDLVAYYKCDENAASTTVADAHGSNTATASANTNTIYNANGKINSDFNLEIESSNYIDTGFEFDRNSFSISIWYKPETWTGGTTYSNTLVSDVDGSQGAVFLRGGSADNKINFLARSTTLGGWATITSGALTPGTWYHIVATYDDGDMELFIDGSSVGTDTSNTGSLRSSDDIQIGRDGTVGRYIDGDVDEIAIYSTALNLTSVQDLRNSGDGLAYPFEVPTCTFSGYVKDEEGNGLVGANVTIWNQYNISESYENTTITGGAWSLEIENSTNIYMSGAYYNNTLIGQLKPYISGTC